MLILSDNLTVMPFPNMPHIAVAGEFHLPMLCLNFEMKFVTLEGKIESLNIRQKHQIYK